MEFPTKELISEYPTFDQLLDDEFFWVLVGDADVPEHTEQLQLEDEDDLDEDEELFEDFFELYESHTAAAVVVAAHEHGWPFLSLP